MEYDSPCTHAIVAARRLHVDPYSLFRYEYTIAGFSAMIY